MGPEHAPRCSLSEAASCRLQAHKQSSRHLFVFSSSFNARSWLYRLSSSLFEAGLNIQPCPQTDLTIADNATPPSMQTLLLCPTVYHQPCPAEIPPEARESGSTIHTLQHSPNNCWKMILAGTKGAVCPDTLSTEAGAAVDKCMAPPYRMPQKDLSSSERGKRQVRGGRGVQASDRPDCITAQLAESCAPGLRPWRA